jgi:O-antigen/teichoic acid export membrane protein
MGKVISLVKGFFSEGHERTIKAKKNVVFSFFIRAASILVSLLNVPLAIRYVNSTQYGVWLTLSALFIWFSLFDIGFGNGLKNRLTEALAQGDRKLARTYVSTSYFFVTLISLALFGLFLLINTFLDWSSILRTDAAASREIGTVVLIVFAIFAVQFVLQLLNIICLAKHNSVITALIGLAGNLFGLTALVILTKTTKGSLLALSLSIGLGPLAALLLFTLVLFFGRYRELSPSFRLVNRAYAKDIMSLGIKFFIIQIGLIFYYNCDNLIITHVLGPQAVTPYNIAFRYFNSIAMISNILMMPFWPAFTEAHTKEDFAWIKSTVAKLEKICLILFGVSLVMLSISPIVYRIWLGDEVVIPLELSAIVAVYTVLLTFRTIYCYYMNGVGKIMLQLYLVIISGIINIPLGIYLCKKLGVAGVLLSTTLLCVISAFFEKTQYRKLISNTAKGIWNK